MSSGNGKLHGVATAAEFAEHRRETTKQISEISQRQGELSRDSARDFESLEREIRQLTAEILGRSERLASLGLDIGSIKRELNGHRGSVENRIDGLNVLLKRQHLAMADGFSAISGCFADVALRHASDNEYRDLQASVQTARNEATDQLLMSILAQLEALTKAAA